MGTNYYWIVDNHGCNAAGERIVEPGETAYDMDPAYHIGLRSAAGWYCYDCRVTLCTGGESAIHMGTHSMAERCLRCGQARNERGYNAAMVELGLENTPEPPRKLTGVQGASSFSWAQDPDAVVAVCTSHLFDQIIEDEYGERLTGQAFLWMLDVSCPIRFTHSIGVAFC